MRQYQRELTIKTMSTKRKKKGGEANMKVFSFFFYCKSLIFSPYFYIKRLLIILGIHTTHSLFGFDCKLPTTTLSVPSLLSIPLFALNMSTLPLRWSSFFINNEWSRPRTIRVFNQNKKSASVRPSPLPRFSLVKRPYAAESIVSDRILFPPSYRSDFQAKKRWSI